MGGKNKKLTIETSNVVAPRTLVNQLFGLYLIVAFMLSLSWLLGTLSYSFLWIFAIIFGLFIVWRTRLKDLVDRNLEWHTQHYHRKRALRQEESAEWLNFVINRWWVFSSVSIEDVVRRRINDRLLTVKPSFIDNLELTGFTFGDITPSLRCVKAFECSDGVPGFKPASWSSICQPPVGLNKLSAYRVVLEADMASRCEDFRMVFQARVGNKQVGVSFDVAVEELRVKGTLQIVLHMSMELPFPHIAKATVSFTELPEVWFNVKVLKALQLMEIPILKSWIHINVMEGITKALVDPGKIDIPITKTGPINAHQFMPQKKTLANGVLTIQLKGTPAVDSGEDVHYTRLRVGNSKRQTVEVPASQAWEDCCSFFVFNLAKDQLNIKNKCKRLLTTVTLEQHDLDLASFPFQVTKLVNHEVENKDGSKVNLQMDYSPLPQIDLTDEQPVNVLQRAGVVYVCVHCANNVVASDKTGSSDPYCVVFTDRRRVLTTPYMAQNRNPSWESHAEFFVKDFTQCNLSFYVFDWDGTNTLDDDFLGSASFSLSEKQPSVVKKTLTLGYNKQGEGHTDDLELGAIVISIMFRPVPSVERSEKYRLTSTDSVNNNNNDLYVEDLVSPGTMFKGSANPSLKVEEHQGGGRRMSKYQPTKSLTEAELLQDKVFVDLTILQAKDLVPMDRNGYSDPFCEVSIDGSKIFCTSVKKKTLFPKWNEAVTFQVTEQDGMIELQLYDKDIFINDFLGKLMLTLDQLKELSLKGSSGWFPLQHTHSGQLQLRCTVTARDTLKREVPKQAEAVPSITVDNSNTGTQGYKDMPVRGTSLESDVFMPQSDKHLETDTLKLQGNGVDGHLVVKSDLTVNKVSPHTSTPNPKDYTRLRRSASDVNIEKRSLTNSINSVALHDMDISTVLPDPNDTNEESKSPHREEKDAFGDRLFNVTGKVMSVLGLKFNEGSIYVKVRAVAASKQRLRSIFGHRVLAKSPLVRASQPLINLPFDIDKGMGISGDTQLKFDVKRDGKYHLATKAFTLRSLFDGPGGEGDKIQKVLSLENNIQLEVYLQHSPPDITFLRRRTGPRIANNSRSFRR